MNEVQPTQQPSSAEDSVQGAALPSASRRRLIRGGLVGAPVVLTAVSTPVMATTCKTASRFASMHSSLTGKDNLCLAIFDFPLAAVLDAMGSLNLKSLTTSALGLKKETVNRVLAAINSVKEKKLNATTALLADTVDVISKLAAFDKLLLLTYLNTAVPSTNFSTVISLIDVQRMANMTYSSPYLKPNDIEPYLCSLFGFATAAEAKINVF